MKSFATLAIIGLISISVYRLAASVPMTPTEKAADKKAVPAPEFTDISDWLNAKPMKMADLKKSVVVVHFWTNGCINCVHNYPYYQKWMEQYKDSKDFQMIGVHTPEFDSEKNVDRLKDKIKDNKLTFVVAVDNKSATWKAWGNEYWPCIYVVDKAGNIREKWDGELREKSFELLTDKIGALLKE
ncbi:hypothetical protein BH11PLA2_BH11PLA2_45300 [soil metagenome]